MFPLKLAIAFHVFACFQSAFALYIYHHLIEIFRKRTFGGHWKYMTYINLHLQFLCFALCVLNDFLKQVHMQSQARKVQLIKDFVYAVLALPSCICVFITFWGLYAIDRELVYPSYLDEFLPAWSNQVWHTAILIILVEGFCEYHFYPPRYIGLPSSIAAGLLYFFWLEIVHSRSGVAVYPFLRELSGISYLLFLFGETGFICLIYFAGEHFNKLMKPPGKHTPKSKRKTDYKKRR